MPALERLIKAPYFLSFVRIAGHYGLALTAFLVPAVGENRMLVAALLAFVIGPAVFALSLKFNSTASARFDPFVDLVTLLIVTALLPEFWYPALLIGVVIAQAPAMSVETRSYRLYSVSIALLIIGMSAIAEFRDVENWLVPILALIAIYPAVVLYSFLQTIRVNEMRERADALSALQLLAGGVAHDFNNIMTGISGYAEYVKNSGFEPQAAERAVDKILESAQRAGLLTRQLISFSGEKKIERQPVDLCKEVQSIADMLRATLQPGIKIKVDAPLQSLKTLGDPAQLHQVLLNLMINAVEATRTPGVIRVRVSQVEDQVQVEVADDGEGVPESVKENLFQPFVTSKQNGHGLGLAVVKNIVDQHKGTVDLVSNVGLGARFILRLPILEHEHEAAARQSFGNTILIADDEMPIRVILRQVLEMEGFDVMEAEDGDQFLKLYESHRADICAIVLDIKMPGRTGWQCLDEVRRGDQNLPALVISGYDPEGPTIERPDHAMRFLAKPFRIAEVKEAIVALIADAHKPALEVSIHGD